MPMSTAAAFAPQPADTVWPAIRWSVARDLKLALRSRAELGVQLLFYVIVASLFPLATTPERNTLAAIGPGVLWVAALLASLLSLPRLFAGDHADGTLEQIALSPYPLVALVAGKIVAHWLTTGLPVVLIAPLLGLQYALDGEALVVLTAALLIGTPILSLLGAIGAALTLGLALERKSPRAADPSAVRSGADLRGRRGRCGAHGPRSFRASVAARRRFAGRMRRRAVRLGRRRADRPRLG